MSWSARLPAGADVAVPAAAFTCPSLACRIGTSSSQELCAVVIEARGNGRHRRLHLTGRFYDLAQDRNAYVRIKAMDPLQQEHMVAEYARTYGKITRSQAANLCQLSPDEARRLLKRMTEKGSLRLVGTRRTAHYELS